MNYIAILIAFGPFLIGVSLVVAARKELRLAWRSRRWPHTVGRMFDLGVEEGTQLGLATDGTFAPQDQAFRGVYLVYSYIVEGQEYRSSRYSFAMDASYERQYEEGATLTVYYDPSDPSVSVLKPGVTGSLLAGPFFLGIGLPVLIGFLILWW